MASLTIKNLPDDLYVRLKENAESHHRSLNSEIIVSLERALKSTRIDPEELLVEIRTVRARIKAPPLTDEFLHEAKNKGRP